MPIDPRMMQQQDEPEAVDTADEDMLEQVRMGMGNEGGPPPGSGLKWQDLAEDQQALEANPSPENVQAFVQYWGQENLPPDLKDQAAMGAEGGMQMPDSGEY
jgi:hypothetical protein